MNRSPRLSRFTLSRRALLNGAGALVLGVPAPGRPRAAQPAAPTLTGIVWQWQATVAPDGTLLWQPDHPERYTVTFGLDGAMTIQADCNRARGTYAVNGSTLTLQVGGVTRMRCAVGSLMDRFLGELEYAVALQLTSEALVLVLTAGEAMRFTPAPSVPATPSAA